MLFAPRSRTELVSATEPSPHPLGNDMLRGGTWKDKHSTLLQFCVSPPVVAAIFTCASFSLDLWRTRVQEWSVSSVADVPSVAESSHLQRNRTKDIIVKAIWSTRCLEKDRHMAGEMLPPQEDRKRLYSSTPRAQPDDVGLTVAGDHLVKCDWLRLRL